MAGRRSGHPPRPEYPPAPPAPKPRGRTTVPRQSVERIKAAAAYARKIVQPGTPPSDLDLALFNMLKAAFLNGSTWERERE